MKITCTTADGRAYVTALLIASTLLPGCRDSSRNDDAGGARNDAAMTAPANVEAAAARAQERVHRYNAQDWVGTTHNRYLRDLRREIRKPGVLTRNICAYLTDFVAQREGRDIRLSAAGPDAFRRSAEAGLAVTSLCVRSPVSPASYIQEADLVLSPAATELITRTAAATETSPTSTELATVLLQAMSAAETLPQMEREVVSATVSVAQSSFEFWETEYAAMQQDFYVEYGACLQQVRESGYTMETGLDACLKGAVAYTRLPLESSQQLSVAGALPAFSRRLECGLAKNFRKVVKADLDGALAGALKGARGGAGAAAAGAAGGAVLASAAAYIKGTWDMFWCAM